MITKMVHKSLKGSASRSCSGDSDSVGIELFISLSQCRLWSSLSPWLSWKAGTPGGAVGTGGCVLAVVVAHRLIRTRTCLRRG
eukprot:258737-Amphidinium_carterae.1